MLEDSEPGLTVELDPSVLLEEPELELDVVSSGPDDDDDDDSTSVSLIGSLIPVTVAPAVPEVPDANCPPLSSDDLQPTIAKAAPIHSAGQGRFAFADSPIEQCCCANPVRRQAS